MTRYALVYRAPALTGRDGRVLRKAFLSVSGVFTNMPRDYAERQARLFGDETDRLLIQTDDPRVRAGQRLPRGVQGARTWFPQTV
jgi:hypothetical protein